TLRRDEKNLIFLDSEFFLGLQNVIGPQHFRHAGGSKLLRLSLHDKVHFPCRQRRKSQQTVLGGAATGCDHRIFGFKTSNLKSVIELFGTARGIDIPGIDYREVMDLQLPAKSHLYELDSISGIFDS